MSKFEDLLNQLGTGKWNFIFFIVCSYCSFLVPFHALSGPFVAPKLEHSCKTSQASNWEPWEDNTNTTQNLCFYQNDGNQTECTEWDYDNRTFTNTITSEFNWVCGYKYLRATYTSMYMIGNFFGAPINGVLSDSYGRRTTTTVGCLVWVIMGVLSSWLPNAMSILIARFIMGFAHPVMIQASYGLAMEVCQPRYRSTVGILLCLPWAISTAALGGFAYFIRDWRYLQLTISLPGLLIFPLLWYLNESPRWLLVQGHVDQAKKVLQKASHYNRVTLPEGQSLDIMLVDIQKESMNEKKAPEESTENTSYTKRFQRSISGVLVLFRTPQIRQIMLLLYIDFFVVSMVYYGISLNGVNYGVDPFLYMVISAASELPAYTLAVPLIATFGRRLPITWSFLICGVAIVSLAFIPNNDSTWGLILFMAMVGKIFISIVYQVLYLYTMELLPTEVRLTGLGTTGCVSRIGSILCPYVTDTLGVVYPWLPSLIFGGFSIIAGLTNLGLHETLGTPMPDTVEDIENFNKTRKSIGNDNSSEQEKLNPTSPNKC